VLTLLDVKRRIQYTVLDPIGSVSLEPAVRRLLAERAPLVTR